LGNEIMKPTISTKGRGHINKKITNLVAFPSYTCRWDAAYLHKSPFTPIIVAHFNLTYHDKFGPCKFFSTHAIFESTISYTQTIKYGLHFYDVDIIVCWWHWLYLGFHLARLHVYVANFWWQSEKPFIST
jgi:hypothetical protein